MNWQQKNVAVYDESAQALSAYFSGIGSRIDDIERGISLVKRTDAIRAVEIGCGDGRDAIEIAARVDWYEGFDPSKNLLTIARRKVLSSDFVLADALTYNYPANVSIVFAFASLLHVPKDDLPQVFTKVSRSLESNGIFYISLKYRDTYTEEVKSDAYGDRMFYYYTPELINELAGSEFQEVYRSTQTIGSTDWFTIALKRR